jgi:hypothetical protein
LIFGHTRRPWSQAQRAPTLLVTANHACDWGLSRLHSASS